MVIVFLFFLILLSLAWMQVMKVTSIIQFSPHGWHHLLNCLHFLLLVKLQWTNVGFLLLVSFRLSFRRYVSVDLPFEMSLMPALVVNACKYVTWFLLQPITLALVYVGTTLKDLSDVTHGWNEISKTRWVSAM